MFRSWLSLYFLGCSSMSERGRFLHPFLFVATSSSCLHSLNVVEFGEFLDSR